MIRFLLLHRIDATDANQPIVCALAVAVTCLALIVEASL